MNYIRRRWRLIISLLCIGLFIIYFQLSFHSRPMVRRVMLRRIAYRIQLFVHCRMWFFALCKYTYGDGCWGKLYGRWQPHTPQLHSILVDMRVRTLDGCTCVCVCLCLSEAVARNGCITDWLADTAHSRIFTTKTQPIFTIHIHVCIYISMDCAYENAYFLWTKWAAVLHSDFSGYHEKHIYKHKYVQCTYATKIALRWQKHVFFFLIIRSEFGKLEFRPNKPCDVKGQINLKISNAHKTKNSNVNAPKRQQT